MASLEKMVLSEDYPGVESIVSAYEQHCCEDDALAGRSSALCDEPDTPGEADRKPSPEALAQGRA